MSTEQKLREVVIDLKQKVIELCRLCNYPLPYWSLEQADRAIATTEPEPEPTGMPEIKPWDHPEPQTMRWSDLEIRWIQSYGEQCWKAGYKHGAWADKPAVSQQLTTEPVDEREAFEKWAAPNRFDVGHKGEGGSYLGRATGIAWAAWQARAAMAQGVK